MIRSAEIEHQIRFSISGTSKFSEARKVVGKTHVVRKMVLVFSLTEAGEITNWLGPWKVPSNYGCCWKGMPYLPNFHAKIDSTITKYIGHNFTKVTTFIIIIIKNNYKNCYLGKIICESSLV